MFMTTSQPENDAQQPSYIVAAPTTTTTATNAGLETPTLSNIKILCTQSRKKSKRHMYLTFVDSHSLSSSDEQPCIEILGKTNSSPILLNDCISLEYFDTIRNDFQSFIYIYFESYTISIYFSDKNFPKKPLIIKHLQYMYQNQADHSLEITNQQPPFQELPNLTINEQILHTFDLKLIPYESIIPRNHTLIGPTRLYFTTTDLYIASINCTRMELKTTIINQCPSKAILCIPYFTIRQYGNRSNIFLIELGKSNYGDGEIHMKCFSSSFASTIHLLVSPVIEERPIALSSAFQSQFLTNKRIEKSKNIHPPMQFNYDTKNQTIIDPPLLFMKRPSADSLPSNLNTKKSRSLVGFFRKLVRNPSSLQKSYTFNSNQDHLNAQSEILSSSTTKFVEINIQEKQFPNDQHSVILPKSQSTTGSSNLLTAKTTKAILTSSSNTQETTIGTYIDLGPTIQISDPNQQEEIQEEERVKPTTATVDIGVNTTISLPSHIRSAIIVGNSVHLIAEERAEFPIGQRSFTSPASIMQPFRAQLNGQTTINTYTTSADMITCTPNSSSSFHQPTSASSSQHSLLLSYGIVTFNNNNSFSTDQTECASNILTDVSTIDRRLNSDLSLMSISHQQQPSNIYSFDNILSSPSNSHIFRTLSSYSANNIGDSTSGHVQTSPGSIIFYDENLTDQTTSYLLGPPPLTLTDDSLQTNLPRLSSLNLTTSISRAHLSHIDEEKLSLIDPYALVEPLSLDNSSSLPRVLTKPLLSSTSSINYTDLLLPSNLNSGEALNTSGDMNDFVDEKNERSSTILYTDIDYHQTQRRDCIAQLAAKSKSEDQAPPFVL